VTVSLARLIRTITPLKPVQIYGRLAAHLPKRPIARRLAPPLRVFPAGWTTPIAAEPSLIGPAEVRLLNQFARLDGPGAWNDPTRSKLWLYNLHYFNGLGAPVNPERVVWRQALTLRWIAENPPGEGVGWEPFPTALRIVNWIKWALAGEATTSLWRDSLATQADWLEGSIEWRLLGNHLLANAKALIFAGLYFSGPDADRRLAKGLRLHQKQLTEQILDDGGHFERSPMYHALALEDLLDLINLAQASSAIDQARIDEWAGIADRMADWLASMAHPDGQISFFNDAAFAVAAAPSDLFAYAQRLGLRAPSTPTAGAVWLKTSGYVRLAQGDAVALIDAAPIGPDHQPGHAHADTLSFELSVGRERIIVNGGTSVYGDGPDRQAERSTAAHSTVVIDGCDSSEVWAGFRVGRRARVSEVRVADHDGVVEASAAHDGYIWRPGRPVHRRRWRLQSRRLSIADAIEGEAETAVAHFHLGPGVQGRADPEGQGGELIAPSGRRLRWRCSRPARVAASLWRPEFGLRLDARRLIVPMSGPTLLTIFSW
jgi:uncharacterized heparinase superfamily protein